ncbi:MAG: hypothetical protein JO021_08830, partial [Alphaproteobacteria bacterium]|nr:hypothetical protein [Alphaproteobacteria bacterium]
MSDESGKEGPNKGGWLSRFRRAVTGAEADAPPAPPDAPVAPPPEPPPAPEAAAPPPEPEAPAGASPQEPPAKAGWFQRLRQGLTR